MSTLKEHAMRYVLILLVFLATPTAAAEPGGCSVYGASDEATQWRLCPDGTIYERNYRYYGLWSSWQRPHPNVTAPCLWHRTEKVWRCPDRTVRCDTICK